MTSRPGQGRGRSADRADVVVVGAGVFGLASALELARRGRRVIAVDRLGPGHPATSSAGASRSIRVAYDHRFYVRLALDALDAWRDLEERSGRRILHLTGQVDVGEEERLAALARTVRRAGATIEELDEAGLRRRLPELRARPGEVGLFHLRAGTVLAAEGLAALAEAAVAAGVTLLAPERVTDIDLGATAVLRTERRRLEADAVVVSGGPWSGAILAGLGIDVPLAPAVAQVTFLDAPALVDRPGVVEWPADGEIGVYGHPVPGVGYKVAFDGGRAGWDPETTAWDPDRDEEQRLLAWLAERMPGVEPRVALTQRHPWTLTADSDFVIDRRGPVTMACGCSGHAFKFGPALGPLVADVLDGGEPPPLLRLDRPGLRSPPPSPEHAIAR